MMRALSVLLTLFNLYSCATGSVQQERLEGSAPQVVLAKVPEGEAVPLSVAAVELALSPPPVDSQELLLEAVIEATGELPRPSLEAPLRLPVERREGEYTVLLPLAGLRAGGRYSLRARFLLDGTEGAYSEPVRFSLAEPPLEVSLSLEDPVLTVPLSPGQRVESVDRTPEITLSVAGATLPTVGRLTILAAGGEVIQEREASLSGGEGRFAPGEALPAESYRFELALRYASGVLRDAPGPYLFEIVDMAAPVPTAHGEGVAGVENPALRWEHRSGVQRYEVSLLRETPAPQSAEELLPEAETIEVERPGVLLSAEELVQGATYLWRARGISEEGPGPWSGAYSFDYEPRRISFLPVVTGEVRFTQGSEGGSRDEGPPREVTLTKPFELAETELTNDVAALLLTSGLIHRRFEIDSLVVRLAGSGEPLVYLDTLEYGEQLGLAVDTENRIVPVAGRAAHPAVGVSWYGALALARELSYLEGRRVVPLAPSSEGFDPMEIALVAGQTGYTLPTEAQWEYAATGGEGIPYPWGSASVRGRANYYRSGDPFEDVNPPYTRAGGPTTPVGFFGEASPFGQRDLLGNVWEWCLDYYDPAGYPDGAVTDPRGPAEAVADEFGVVNRALRGLAWNSRVEDLRLTNRGKYPAELASWSIGVRFVRTGLPAP